MIIVVVYLWIALIPAWPRCSQNRPSSAYIRRQSEDDDDDIFHDDDDDGVGDDDGDSYGNGDGDKDDYISIYVCKDALHI